MTEHDMESIHAPHAHSCIHNRYSKIGDSYSNFVFSLELQIGISYCHMLNDQLGNNSVWYTCKLWPMVGNSSRRKIID